MNVHKPRLLAFQMAFQAVVANLWNAKINSGMPMCAQATRVSELKIRFGEPAEKDRALFDGAGLQMRVISNSFKL